MFSYIADFCWEFDYPEEAFRALTDCYEKIRNHPEAKATLEKALADYEAQGTAFKPNEGMTALRAFAEAAGVHSYTLDLLYYLLLSKHLRTLYTDAGISHRIYHDSMLDLKWKLWECKKLYNIWGSFVAWWFCGWYTLERFTLGRLQFEYSTWNGEETYECEGLSFPKGSPALNMHIPSSGPLTYESCVDSFRQAYEFYRGRFDSDKILFVCNSWLLYHRHPEFLPKTSNILKFMSFFDLREREEHEGLGNCWRIFNCEYPGTPKDLPRDTGLRKAYAEWIEKENKSGGARGAFLFDGKTFYRHDV